MCAWVHTFPLLQNPEVLKEWHTGRDDFACVAAAS